jgi:hypothetical protein
MYFSVSALASGLELALEALTQLGGEMLHESLEETHPNFHSIKYYSHMPRFGACADPWLGNAVLFPLPLDF